ncbi:MAG: TerC family protein [Flavobacteriales bacterium]|jgi:predicted tellurium resistance membrane protein TerC|nr:TerC family protein [Flavobacteriales bacterium]MBP7157106.1 TerC family protein [Flavobacteriales bacterium]
MEHLLNFPALISLITLALLEIVLGVDNVVFVSIILGRMPKEDRPRGRMLWMVFGILMRCALLLGLGWLVKNGEQELFSIMGYSFNLRNCIMFFGGLFLLYKAVTEIHHKLEGPDATTGIKTSSKSFAALMVQIVIVDAVFSFDSVVTAIGLAQHIEIMITAVVIAMFVMFFFAKAISDFIERHPAFKMLALSFLVMVGFMLFFEGLEPIHHHEIPKGYAYVAMAFSFGVELLNLKTKKSGPVKLKR